MSAESSIYIYGYIHGMAARFFEDVKPSIYSHLTKPIVLSQAARTPAIGFAQLNNYLVASHALRPQLATRIAELSERIDWAPDNENPIVLERQGTWQIGYYHGLGDRIPMVIKNLQEARKFRGMSQEELARKIGCTQKDVSRWESGVHQPSIERLKKIASALDCMVDNLTGGE